MTTKSEDNIIKKYGAHLVAVLLGMTGGQLLPGRESEFERRIDRIDNRISEIDTKLDILMHRNGLGGASPHLPEVSKSGYPILLGHYGTDRITL